jgi:hypothetical protein
MSWSLEIAIEPRYARRGGPQWPSVAAMNPRDVTQKSASSDPLRSLPSPHSTQRAQAAHPHAAFRVRKRVLHRVCRVLSLFYAQGKVDGDTLCSRRLFVFAFIVAFFFILPDWNQLKVFRSEPDRIAVSRCRGHDAVRGVLRAGHPPRFSRRSSLSPSCSECFAVIAGKIAILGFVSVVLFVLLSVLRYANNHDAEILRLDMLQCLVMAVTLPWILFLEGHLQRLHQGLADVRMKLEDIEEKAARDELTGVYNRRALLAAMHDSKLRSDVTGEPFSICMIDLDLFKRYNDEFDHLTGDQVLRTFARAVMDGLARPIFSGAMAARSLCKYCREPHWPVR